VPNASFSADVLGCLPPEGWAITEDLIGKERRGMKGRRTRKERGDHHVLHFNSSSLIYPAFQSFLLHFLIPTSTPSTTSTSTHAFLPNGPIPHRYPTLRTFSQPNVRTCVTYQWYLSTPPAARTLMMPCTAYGKMRKKCGRDVGELCNRE
jgi:hypothetical protein